MSAVGSYQKRRASKDGVAIHSWQHKFCSDPQTRSSASRPERLLSVYYTALCARPQSGHALHSVLMTLQHALMSKKSVSTSSESSTGAVRLSRISLPPRPCGLRGT